jgi:hypothetical protein
MELKNCPNCGANNNSNSKYCSQCGHEIPAFEYKIPDNPVENQLVTIKNNPNRKKVIRAIVSVLAFFLSYYAVQHFVFAAPSIDKALMQTASELNKTCPIMVDKYTRLDNAVALPDKTFQYNYTILGTDALKINLDTLKNRIEPGIINNVKTNPEMKSFRDDKVTLVYNYYYKEHVFAFKIPVTPDMYQ